MTHASIASHIEDGIKNGSSLSAVALIDGLIEHAHETRASDIHIVPEKDSLRVRFRIDGVLHDMYTLPKTIHHEIIARIKILTHLPTDEHQAPLDGRFRAHTDTPIDVRVSIVPTYHGENANLRLLSNQANAFTLDTLGLTARDKEVVMNAIQKPHGMILSTGPTGSGKTTTLYTLIKMLNTSETSIITIEDPIEYAMHGIEQVQINPRSGLTFANGLRAFLRQDPNIIMVGEIRDRETASLAVNTALTGHLLLSTVHTNNAATTLPRLIDMGVEPFLIASTVTLTIGQRLVRKICDACKIEKVFSSAERDHIIRMLPPHHKSSKLTFFEGKGCNACNGTGYKGRIGIYEVLSIDSAIQNAILQKASALTIHEIATSRGMTTMVDDGMMKARAGLTTLHEIIKVTHE